MNNERLEVISKLVHFSWPLSDIKPRLNSLGWDFCGQPVELNSSHLREVLCRYLTGELSGEDVAGWASMIEMRDDVEITDDVQKFMHELANPYLEGNLDMVRANAILDEVASR